MDDLLCVNRDEYLPVLFKFLPDAVNLGEYYDPSEVYFRKERIDYFDRASVAVTPVGLVLIYTVNTAGSSAEGCVFLKIPYDELQGIINPVFFPTFAG